MLALFLAVQASAGATHDEGAIWRGAHEAPQLAAPAAWTDGDPRTYAELDPGDARAELRIGLVFATPRPLTAFAVDFLSLYEHVYDGVASASALELLGPDGWCPVAATLTRDTSHRGDLARFQQYGGVVWRLVFPRCEARGARLVLRRTADERTPWRRYVVRELATGDDATLPLHPIEGDAIGATLDLSRNSARDGADATSEAAIDWARPERGATRSFDGEGVVIRWPRPRFVGEVEVGEPQRAEVEWWDGGEWRPVRASGRDPFQRDGRNRKSERPLRATTRFIPVATQQLRVLGIDEETTVAVRLGSEARGDATRVAASGRDLLLERLLDPPDEPDFRRAASALLPNAATAAVIGRPNDPVETLVTWNATLHETEHGDEGAWISGAPSGGGGRERWVDRWCAFALGDELVGADPDRVARATFARGRPGVVTSASGDGVELTIREFVTAPADPWATVVTLRVVNVGAAPRVAKVSALLGRKKSMHAAHGELDLAPLPTGHQVDATGRIVRDAAGSLLLVTPDAADVQLGASSPFETTVTFTAELAPQASHEFHLLLPSVNAPKDPGSDAATLACFDFAAASERFDRFWDAQLATFELALPEAPFDALVPALLAQCHIVLFDDAPNAAATAKPGDPPSLRLKYGAYAYEDYFGLEEAWPTLALAQFGQFEAAQRAAERMLAPDLLDPANYHHQYRMGIAATTAVRVAALTHDAGFVARIAPRLDAVADWIVTARHREDGAGGEYAGLLPKHTYGGDITTPARSLFANAACWRGLHEIALLLQERGDPRAGTIARDAVSLRARITEVASAAVERDHDPPFVPMAVDLGEGDGDGKETAYDFLPADPLGNYWSLFAPLLLETEVFPPQSELADWIRSMRVERGGALCLLARFHDGVDPVYGLGGTLALADSEEARGFLAGAYGFFAHALDRDVFTGGEVEGVFPLRTSNVALATRLAETRWHWNLYFGDGMADEAGRAVGSEPLSASAGVGLELVRRMLVEELPSRAERDADPAVTGAPPRTLALLHYAPPSWLADGKTIRLALPTEFGVVKLLVESHADEGHIDGSVELVAPPPPSTPPSSGSSPTPAPAQIVLWLNHPNDATIDKVKVDGAQHSDFQDSCVLLPVTGAHTFRVDY